MESKTLKKILDEHHAWLKDRQTGKRANLECADLSDADLRCANLIKAYLSGANLINANLSDANLRDAKVDCNTTGYFSVCPDVGSFIAFKKAHNLIVVLNILSDAQRSSATSLKCRCDKATVLRIENLDGSISDLTSVTSDYDENFIYTVGKTVQVNNFDTNRWSECSSGIHFFLSRDLAVLY